MASQAVDRGTVAKPELLASATSSEDRELIEEYFASGDVFRGVVDPTVRVTLLSTIGSLSGLIPSLRSFSENLKYLELCCHILKQIVPAKRGRSIHQSFADAYSALDEQVVEHAEGKRKKRPWRGVKEGLWLSYVQLWAFCMRHFPSITHIAPRKEPRGRKPSTCSSVSSLLHHLGSLASALSFRTKEALKLREQDPHVALASRLLGTVRSVSDSDAGLHARMASETDFAEDQELSFVLLGAAMCCRSMIGHSCDSANEIVAGSAIQEWGLGLQTIVSNESLTCSTA